MDWSEAINHLTAIISVIAFVISVVTLLYALTEL